MTDTLEYVAYLNAVKTKASELDNLLIKGAIATVNNCGYRDDSFSFGLEFDEETWIDMYGNIKPVSAKHLFYLRENRIERV